MACGRHPIADDSATARRADIEALLAPLLVRSRKREAAMKSCWRSLWRLGPRLRSGAQPVTTGEPSPTEHYYRIKWGSGASSSGSTSSITILLTDLQKQGLYNRDPYRRAVYRTWPEISGGICGDDHLSRSCLGSCRRRPSTSIRRGEGTPLPRQKEIRGGGGEALLLLEEHWDVDCRFPPIEWSLQPPQRVATGP